MDTANTAKSLGVWVFGREGKGSGPRRRQGICFFLNHRFVSITLRLPPQPTTYSIHHRDESGHGNCVEVGVAKTHLLRHLKGSVPPLDNDPSSPSKKPKVSDNQPWGLR